MGADVVAAAGRAGCTPTACLPGLRSSLYLLCCCCRRRGSLFGVQAQTCQALVRLMNLGAGLTGTGGAGAGGGCLANAKRRAPHTSGLSLL